MAGQRSWSEGLTSALPILPPPLLVCRFGRCRRQIRQIRQMREGPRKISGSSHKCYVRCFCAGEGICPWSCLCMPTMDWGPACALGKWGGATGLFMPYAVWRNLASSACVGSGLVISLWGGGLLVGPLECCWEFYFSFHPIHFALLTLQHVHMPNLPW